MQNAKVKDIDLDRLGNERIYKYSILYFKCSDDAQDKLQTWVHDHNLIRNFTYNEIGYRMMNLHLYNFQTENLDRSLIQFFLELVDV